LFGSGDFIMRIALLSTLVLALGSAQFAHAASWEERMLLQLNKTMTVDLVDTKLSEACALISQVTGLTIILDPKVRKDDPVVNLRVNDMDSGTFIKWMTKLSNTHAQLKDHAIFITDKPDEVAIEDEKNDLAIMAATMKAEITLPPQGVPLTDADRVQIALKMIEKLDVKPTDFPGPDIGLGAKENSAGASPFQIKP
jgi:hypothetical protein